MKAQNTTHSLVINGRQRLVAELELAARAEIEQKYAERWKAAGWFRRWTLSRRMHREVVRRVNERMAQVSAESLY